jgi:hypothetical protein
MDGVDPTPWLDLPGDAEQMFPVFLGATARELALGLPPASGQPAQAWIDTALKAKGESAAQRIRQSLGVASAEFEIWTAEDYWGQLAWVFARWRPDAQSPWRWLREGDYGPKPWRTVDKPIFAQTLDPFKAADQSQLFDDFLLFDDPYQQPEYAQCAWVGSDGHTDYAWLPPRDREANRQRFSTGKHYTAYCVSQPSWLGNTRVTFRLKADAVGSVWDDRIAWVPSAPRTVTAKTEPVRVASWPAGFDAAYRADVETFAGDDSRFRIKGSFQPNNDLEALVDTLEARYRALGIETERQRFTWRGIPQSNLVAKIRGTDGGPPIVLADHIDTAVEEDTFASTGQRVTTHGANDNITATATLLRAAEILRSTKPRHDIWLVHLTGEEYPSDDLGCRQFLRTVLNRKQDLRAVLILDFVGYHRPGEMKFQINPDAVPGALDLARTALGAAKAVAPSVQAIYRPRDSRWNGAYNTDVQVFEELGFPALLFNEYLNYAQGREKFDPYNHQSTDTTAHIKWKYATAIARAAIETVARWAGE